LLGSEPGKNRLAITHEENMFDYIFFGMMLLCALMHASIGMRMRKYGSNKGRLKTAAIASAVGLLCVYWTVSGGAWLRAAALAIGVIGGPWLGVLVSVLPSLKHLGQPQSSDAYAQVQDAAVVIEIGHVYGNGFFVRPDTIVTALHVLVADFGGRMWAHTKSGRLELDLLEVDPTTDLLVLRPKPPASAGLPGRAVLKLAAGSGELQVGDRLVYAGYFQPHRRLPQWKEVPGTVRFKGPLSSYKPEGTPEEAATQGDDRQILVAELATQRGCSGGPLLNADSEVVGIAVRGKDNETIAVPVENLRALLERIS
jgi:S1-C subfamily serine protease